jgi:hypothetical protein
LDKNKCRIVHACVGIMTVAVAVAVAVAEAVAVVVISTTSAPLKACGPECPTIDQGRHHQLNFQPPKGRGSARTDGPGWSDVHVNG